MSQPWGHALSSLAYVNGLVVRFVAIRVERPAQAKGPVGVTARGDGGQPEGSVRLPGTHPHDVGVLALWRPRRATAAAAAATAVVAEFRVVAR